ncbi:hypothetical protein SUGI_0915660 [Cryptomeria japonica]|nr:hypothetical protein SUGI_0915660 [Cryptomeria japonica]
MMYWCTYGPKDYQGKDATPFDPSLVPKSGKVQQWVSANTDKWFAYREYSATVDGDGEVPFILGIQLPEQLDWMLQFGHHNILAMNSTFGTNAMKFQLYTMLAFDSKHMGVAVAWVIMSRSCAHDITYWMCILLQWVHMKNIDWKLYAFMMDDAGAEIKAIRPLTREMNM